MGGAAAGKLSEKKRRIGPGSGQGRSQVVSEKERIRAYWETRPVGRGFDPKRWKAIEVELNR